MKEMYALLAGEGGPLERVFTAALDKKCAPAESIVIEEDGISGILDGHKICAGTEGYMIRNNVKIPTDDYRTAISSTDSTKIMYGAADGEVYVKFFIRYSFSEEFTMMLPILKEQKIVPLVYTRDPNVTNELLKVLTMGEDSMRVMKRTAERSQEQKVYRRISSGAVTVGDSASAVNMVLLAKKYASFQASLSLTELVSMIVGATLAVVLAVSGMLHVPTLIFALWQVAWCVALGVTSFRNFGRRRTSAEDDED